ncbi:hypothetical protein DVH24_017095 [Malus domestica]|uniref:non-specific serine/threonine protein kinase n=1 Tax=Malus domestica TaxID=3750 RepID=A0A498IW82_MALDO|nr:hypothetical protein DVH24_017095 [Malus domestica]
MNACTSLSSSMGVDRKNPGTRICNFSFLIVFCWALPLFCSASSSISQGQSIKDGETLISDGQIFELGFFSLGNSSSRYVGIRYYKISDPSVIWVANRENPISDKSGVLEFRSDGNLVVLDGNGTTVWSTNASAATNSTARLNDEGSLILSRRGHASMVYWQSFDDAADTFLPGMKVEVSDEIGENRFLSSWKSESDPSAGGYSMGVDPRGSPQIVIWEGSKRRWRSGHWNKQIFIGVPNMPTTYAYGFKLSDENGKSYFTYKPWNPSDKLRFRIRWDGYEEQLKWAEEKSQWDVIQSQPNKTNQCEFYNKCGRFGVCSASDESSSICSCMRGFQPRNLDQWTGGNWSEGCSRKTPLQCQGNSTNGAVASDEKDGFVAIRCAKLPDFADLVVTVPGESCEEKCLENCACTAYAIVQGIGCMMWTEDLIDVEKFTKGGNTLHIRVAHSDLGKVQIHLSFLLLVLFDSPKTVFQCSIALYSQQILTIQMQIGTKTSVNPLNSSMFFLFFFSLLLLSRHHCAEVYEISPAQPLSEGQTLVSPSLEFAYGGEDLFVRLDRSELGEGKPIKLISSLTAICLISILGATAFGFQRLRANKKGNARLTDTFKNTRDTLQEYIRKHDPSELFIYNFYSILIATNNFSITNKLGEGGFGPVYKEFAYGGQDLFVRLDRSELGEGKPIKLIASLTAICLICILGAIAFGFQTLRANKKGNGRLTDTIENARDTLQEYIRKYDPSELFIYNFDSILIATNNFSITNKLGEGGFGPVYKKTAGYFAEIIVRCLVWSKDLIDISEFSSGGADLFIRLANAELGEEGKRIKLVASLVSICFIIMAAIVFGLYKLRVNPKGIIKVMRNEIRLTDTSETSRESLREYIRTHDPSELLVYEYDFNSILIATSNFSTTNKLGEGGFGAVYWAKFFSGEEGNQIKLIVSLVAICSISIAALVFGCKQNQESSKARKEIRLTDTRDTSRESLQEYIRTHDPSELLVYEYDFDSIVIATSNFSITNKLGRGGFGIEFSSGGEDLFIRLRHTKSGEGKRTRIIASLSAICFIGVLVAIVFVFCRLQANRRVTKSGNIKVTKKFVELTDPNENSSDSTLQEYIREHEQSDLFIYRFDSVSIATNNFSITNKLGEGGFGPVYKVSVYSFSFF